MGISTMPTNAAKINAADRYIGVVVPSPGMFAARMGAMSPVTLFKKLATPVPAPRTGAGLSFHTLATKSPGMKKNKNIYKRERKEVGMGE